MAWHPRRELGSSPQAFVEEVFLEFLCRFERSKAFTDDHVAGRVQAQDISAGVLQRNIVLQQILAIGFSGTRLNHGTFRTQFLMGQYDDLVTSLPTGNSIDTTP